MDFLNHPLIQTIVMLVIAYAVGLLGHILLRNIEDRRRLDRRLHDITHPEEQ